MNRPQNLISNSKMSGVSNSFLKRLRGNFAKLLPLTFIILAFTCSASAQATFVSSTSGSTTNSHNANSVTISGFTVPSGLNSSLLVVSVAIREENNDNLPFDKFVGSVSYGSTTFTAGNNGGQIGAFDKSGGGPKQVRIEMWYLKMPTPGTNSITVTLANNQTGEFAIGVALFHFVHPINPFRTQTTLCTTPTGATETPSTNFVGEQSDAGTGNSIVDVHVTSEEEDLIVTAIATDDTASPNPLISEAGFPVHTQYAISSSNFGANGAAQGLSGYTATTTCSVTGWKITGNQPYALMGIALIGGSAPTAVTMQSYNAVQNGRTVKIEWQTQNEIDNLGFNIYREAKGIRTRINSELIAGSALKIGGAIRNQSGNRYSWFDTLPKKSKNASYWIEEVDTKGETTLFGPMAPALTSDKAGFTATGNEGMLLSKLANSINLANPSSETTFIETKASPVELTAATVQGQFSLAGKAAVKIAVNKEGWYQISQPQLVAAGLNSAVDSRYLQLFVDGVEQPLSVLANKSGGFDSSSSIGFYGLPLDTPSTDTHVYWLTVGSQPGLRMVKSKSTGPNSAALNFTSTVERKDRFIYFSGLINGDTENFFGSFIYSQPVSQTLNLKNVDLTSAQSAVLEISMQGVTQIAHRVLVELNGTSLGEIDYEGQQKGYSQFSVPNSQLREGINTIRLVGANGSSDFNLVDYIRLTYKHSFNADNDSLKLLVSGKEQVTINGFTSPSIRVFDLTNPNAVQELEGTVKDNRGSYSIKVGAKDSGQRILYALASSQSKAPVSITANSLSNLAATSNAANLLIISPGAFSAAAENLKTARQSEGYQTAVINIEDVYDEFSYGNKSPQAIKSFFEYAKNNWQVAPKFAVLVGDATYDPRNYLGYGYNDMIPTKLLGTTQLETASDDWLTDFDNDGIPEIAIGRLPVKTSDEASAMVFKLLSYPSNKPSASALLVSDVNDPKFSFEQANNTLTTILQGHLQVTELQRGDYPGNTAAAKAQFIAELDSGKAFVNYVGHGYVSVWRDNLFTSNDARVLTNNKLPVFVGITCMNGYFQDVLQDSLGKAMMKSQGGSIASWVSSGITSPEEQTLINQEFYRQLFSGSGEITIGEAAARAKLAITNKELRKTYILLGDPTLKFR
ncbi:MAG: C25 family cysteine peptidase [Acidobacteriota bacterium]